jgi:beta-lactamase regulating signal transducer with metallopeptidase domain/ketosteroid isomerase-like protein
MLSAIGNHIWQTTVFVMATWLVTLSLRQNAARVRFALWSVASVKFLIPFSLLISIGSRMPYPSAAIKPGATFSVVETVSSPFEQPSATSAKPVGTLPQALPARQILNLTPFIIAIWFAGFGAVAVHRTVRLLRTLAVLRQTKIDDVETQFLRQTVALLNKGKEIRLVVSRTVVEPGIYGAMRPTLVLPAGITAKLGEEQLHSVIEHEVQHIERRDNLTATVHMAVEAIFWFHPLVWWIGSRLLAEREFACDEAVMAKGVAPETYAGAILKVCEFYVVPPAAQASGVTGANLKARILSIMTNRQPRALTSTQKLVLTAVAGLVIVGPLALGLLFALPVGSPSTPAQPLPASQFEAARQTIDAETMKPAAKGSTLPATLARALPVGPMPLPVSPGFVQLPNLLNPGFEEGSPPLSPQGWQFGSNGGYFAQTTSDDCYSGNQCAIVQSIRTHLPDQKALLFQKLDALSYRGKQFTFRAAVRARVAGPPDDTARLLMRIHQSDGSSCFFDNMEDRPITSGQWSFYEITGTVCPDAVDLELGMQLWGDGSAWLDDASLSFSGQAQPFAATPGSSQDQQGRQEARIRELITKFTDARNKHDLTTLISLYSEDAEEIGSNGGRTRGRPALLAMWSGTVQSVDHVDRTILRIDELGPNIAAVRVSAQYPPPLGVHEEVFVVVKEPNGSWRIRIKQTVK